MCGRLCVTRDIAALRHEFGAASSPSNAPFRAHWNVCPDQSVPVLRFDPVKASRQLDLMKWGLVAAQRKDTLVLNLVEDCREKMCEPQPGFGGRWSAAQRCLIPIDHYYEWRASD